MPAPAPFSAQIVALYPRLRRYACKLVRDADKADDVAQEAVARALARYEQFQPGTYLFGWLSAIALNLVRSERRRPQRVFADETGELTVSLRSADDQLAALEAKQALACIPLLPEIHQRALWDAYDRIPYAEMAEREGVSVGTIKSRINRARENLAAMAEARP